MFIKWNALAEQEKGLETPPSRGEPQTFSLTPRCGSVEYTMAEGRKNEY